MTRRTVHVRRAALLLFGALAAAAADRGSLMLSGGGVLGPEILLRFQQLARNANASAVILIADADCGVMPTPGNTFLSKLGFGVTILPGPQPGGDDSELVRILEDARAVWIAGGDPEALIAAYSGTRLADALGRLLDRGGVVAGDSAGAGYLARVMIRRPASGPGPRLDVSGLGLLPGIVIDPHFTARGRAAELLPLLRTRPELAGMGIDENTAALIYDGTLEVVGGGSVIQYRLDARSPGGVAVDTWRSGTRVPWSGGGRAHRPKESHGRHLP